MITGSSKDSLAFLGMLLGIIVLFFCTSCSTTISVVNTHGVAEDVVDTEQKTDAEVSPTLDLTPGAI